MSNLPTGVFDDLGSLTDLSLSNGNLAALPATLFSGLASLETLQLDDNDLAALPVTLFSGLTNLEDLRLDNNDLAALPAALFSGLTSLETLQLDNNDLAALPVTLFSGLTSLETLQLDNNELTALPVALFSGLTSLENLQLDNNELAALPAALFSGLTSLEDLRLDNNDLAALPVALFSGLTSLENLRLDNNELAALPVALFSGLTSLENLRLDNNELAALPAALFSGLTRLVTLDVGTNKLTSLPAGIFLDLNRLSETNFSGNENDPIELTAKLVEHSPINDQGEFIVALVTPYGWPGTMEVSLSSTNATPSQTTQELNPGKEKSEEITFKQVAASKDSEIKVCVVTTNGIAIRPTLASINGLKFTEPTCLKIEPPSTTKPTVTITSAKVTQVEGRTAQISFTLHPSATEPFKLRFTTHIDGIDETIDATEGKDYIKPGPTQVIVDQGRGTIHIEIVDDSEIDEGILEYFVVKLIGPENGKDYHIGSKGITSTVIINDGICDRARNVRAAIFEKLPNVSSCYDVTADHLQSIKGELNLVNTAMAAPVTFQAGEFRELSSLETLSLPGVNLSRGLPVGLFEGLESVTHLNMCNSSIKSLNAGVFSDLKKLTHLSVDNNDLESLPADLFKDMNTLRVVKLYSNGITTLDSNVFRDAEALTEVDLYDNKLLDLPAGLFKGLTNLQKVNLGNNPSYGFYLTPKLIDQGNGSFVAEIAEGAPFDISVPFTVAGGTAKVSSVTIPAGSTRTSVINVTREKGNTGKMTVKQSTPTWAGGSNVAGKAIGLLLTAGRSLELSATNSDSP